MLSLQYLADNKLLSTSLLTCPLVHVVGKGQRLTLDGGRKRRVGDRKEWVLGGVERWTEGRMEPYHPNHRLGRVKEGS
jgi:hypothetical protein